MSQSYSKKFRLRKKQEGRLHEFDHQQGDCYEERMIGDEWYVKSYNSALHRWQVAVFSQESFRKYKSYRSYPETGFAK